MQSKGVGFGGLFFLCRGGGGGGGGVEGEECGVVWKGVNIVAI